MAKTILMKDCKAQFHPTLSNSKLGGKDVHIMGVSYMPGPECLTFKNGEKVTDCKGTCTNCAECVNACYAVNSCKRFPNVTKNRVENTMQLREDLKGHFQAIEKAIIDNNVKIVRYTESGEIESLEQLEHLLWLAWCHENVKFYLYTKNYNVLREFFNNHVLPSNMVVLISVWGENGVAAWQEFKKYSNVKCFAVNSGLKVACYCPAYRKDKNGKVVRDSAMTCARCKLCFDSTAKIIGCYEH